MSLCQEKPQNQNMKTLSEVFRPPLVPSRTHNFPQQTVEQNAVLSQGQSQFTLGHIESLSLSLADFVSKCSSVYASPKLRRTHHAPMESSLGFSRFCTH